MPGPPSGRLARLSRERAQPGAMLAVGDGCFRAMALLPHHAAGSWPIQLIGFIVEHHIEWSSMLQHIGVGLFVSQLLSLRRRVLPQDQRTSGCLRQRKDAAELRIAKRVAGVGLAPRPALRAYAWVETLLSVCVRDCVPAFRTCVLYVRSREGLK